MSHYSRVIPALLFLAVILLSPMAFAAVEFGNFGSWPEDWPKELEPLRKDARSFGVGAAIREDIYEIRFKDRTTFERSWPILCQLKSKGGLLTLCKVESTSPKGWGYLLSNTGPAVRIYASPRGSSVGLASGKRLEVGPPWPSTALLPDGNLPEYVD